MVRLLPVPLNGVGVTGLRLVGVLAELFTRAPLSQQIPALIELDLHVSKPLAIGLEPLLVLVVGLLTMLELVLFGHKPFDPRADGLIVHA